MNQNKDERQKGKMVEKVWYQKMGTKRSILENTIKVEYYDVNHPTPLDVKPDDCKA